MQEFQEPVLVDPLADRTNINPVGLAALVGLGILALTLPRRWAALPMLALACFIPSGQRVVILTLDFTFLRLMVVFSWLRIFSRGEWKGLRWHLMDKLLVGYVVVAVLSSLALYRSVGQLVQYLGIGFDVLGIYFLFRCLVRSWRDLDGLVKSFALVSIPVALAFLVERFTHRNAFSIFGGVPEITDIREGRLRCQGAFSHPILGGVFWATLLPLLAARWWAPGGARPLALLSVGCALLIVSLSASSTPLALVGVVLLGAVAWRARWNLREIRWSVVGLLCVLHVIMKKPVWHLISRVNIVGGSTGWHRYHLVDKAIRNFTEWALFGTRSTAHWGPQLFDVTNQYVLVGVRAGFLALVLYVLVMALAFRAVGRTWRRVRSEPRKALLAWAVGISLFAHAVGFLSVSYFGQILVVWYMTLALAANLEILTAREAAARKRAEVRRHEAQPEAVGIAAGAACRAGAPAWS